MKAGIIWAIARKDMGYVFAQRAFRGPAIWLPLIQVVALATYTYALCQDTDPDALSDVPAELLHRLIGQTPPALALALGHLAPGPRLAILISGHIVAPWFLMGPMAVAGLISAAAFVGERERRTLEALLYSPATDGELLTGKLLAALLPALAIAWTTFAGYIVALNLATWPTMGRVWFPTTVWWPWMCWIAPAAILLNAGASVAVSARASSQVAAAQLSGLLSMAATLVMIAEGAGVLGSSGQATWLDGGLLWAVDCLLWAWAVRDFSRARLILRL